MPSLLDLLLAPFRRTPKELSPESQTKVEEALKAVRAQARRCLRPIPADSPQSWLGGAPTLPEGYPWPSAYGRPLAFLAQFDLVEAASAGGPDWLAKDGTLLFFYEGEDLEPDPDNWTVLYFPGTAVLVPTPPPPSLPGDLQFASYPVGFEAAVSLPGLDRVGDIVPGLSKDEEDEVIARLSWEDHQGDPNHQIGGYPDTIQGDHMEWECQLVTNGIPITSHKTYQLPESQRLKGGAQDWQLLLQLDSDERMNAEWVDGGKLYFWIRDVDARKGDFSKVHLTIQFY